jgi:outer membrane protein assembly factor BamB
VLAVNKRTGRELWRRQVPGGKPDFNAPSDCVGSWATPLVASIDGREQLILNVPEKLLSLDPRSGQELWSARGIGKLAYASPVVWKDTVVAMSGYHGPVLAVRATGVGDVTNTHRVWSLRKRQPQRIGSPLAHDGRLYCVNENGTAVCVDLITGETLSSSPTRVCRQTWSSLVQAGDKLYIASLSGEVTVLNQDLSVASRNLLSDRIGSSPAVDQGEIFIRGYDYLYCIADSD